MFAKFRTALILSICVANALAGMACSQEGIIDHSSGNAFCRVELDGNKVTMSFIELAEKEEMVEQTYTVMVPITEEIEKDGKKVSITRMEAQTQTREVAVKRMVPVEKKVAKNVDAFDWVIVGDDGNMQPAEVREVRESIERLGQAGLQPFVLRFDFALPVEVDMLGSNFPELTFLRPGAVLSFPKKESVSGRDTDSNMRAVPLNAAFCDARFADAHVSCRAVCPAVVNATVNMGYMAEVPFTEAVDQDGKEITVTRFRTETRTRLLQNHSIIVEKDAIDRFDAGEHRFLVISDDGRTGELDRDEAEMHLQGVVHQGLEGGMLVRFHEPLTVTAEELPEKHPEIRLLRPGVVLAFPDSVVTLKPRGEAGDR